MTPPEDRGQSHGSAKPESVEPVASPVVPAEIAPTAPETVLEADNLKEPDVGPATKPRLPINVRDVLNEPVTAHMGSAAPLLRMEQTVEQSLEQLRTASNLGRVVYFYVVDDEQRLQGVVPSRQLLLSAATAPIKDIMSPKVIAIPAAATVLDACEFFTLHKLLAFPVVDAERKVIGAVDVDLYTTKIMEIDRRQEGDDLFQLIGVHLSEASQKSSRLAFAGRSPWLLCNVLGGMLSAFIADAYDDVATLAVVAPFIALVTALAESVSIQSVSLALQALHGQPPTWSSFWRKAGFEVLVGLLLGLACGLTVAAIAFLWKGSLAVSLILLLGITGGVTASAVAGLSVPFILRLIRRDPQLASGPMFYFNLGRWVL